jgi:acetoin:2,6-dichlorophenolindophenol oxidoreductase subunit alpha
MEAEPDRERLTWMYRQMLRIREFEEQVKATFTEHPGVIRGHPPGRRGRGLDRRVAGRVASR